MGTPSVPMPSAQPSRERRGSRAKSGASLGAAEHGGTCTAADRDVADDAIQYDVVTL